MRPVPGGAIDSGAAEHVIPYGWVTSVLVTWTFQVAKINKPLLSVSKLIDGDMRVVFDKDGSYLYNKITGDIVRIKRERGVFVIEAFSEFDPNKRARTRSGFRRHT